MADNKPSKLAQLRRAKASRQHKNAKLATRAREGQQQQEYKEILQQLQQTDTIHKDITQYFHATQKVNATKTNIIRKQLADLDTEYVSNTLHDGKSELKEQMQKLFKQEKVLGTQRSGEVIQQQVE